MNPLRFLRRRTLDPRDVLAAYRQGIFPMANEDDGRIDWYSPDPRAIFPLDAFHVPYTLAKTIRQKKFEVRVNTAFEDVLRGCADRESTWISNEIHKAYTALHAHGHAHSVEAWRDDELVGGLYGVSVGGAFMGESMFSRATDASKVCLVHLVERLRERGFGILDCQYPTEHLMKFGMVLIRRAEYVRRLEIELTKSCTFDGGPAAE